MYIGIIYDSTTGDHWYRIEKDMNRVKIALQSIKLPLAVACIFDSSKNDLVELDQNYREYRTELLDKARGIFRTHLHKKIKEPRLTVGGLKHEHSEKSL